MAQSTRSHYKKKKKRTKLKVVIALLVVLGLAERIDYGIPRVIDGDTLEMNGKKIRLYGIDALEKSQQCTDVNGYVWDCGKEAKRYLENLVNDTNILCVRVHKSERHTDKYGRLVSICYTGDLQSINAAMVRSGYAVAFREFSSLYIEEEVKAKKKKNGMWSSQFELPGEARKNKKGIIH